MDKYSELDKLVEHDEKINLLYDFIEYLERNNKDVVLLDTSLEDWVYPFLGINKYRVERERKELLKEQKDMLIHGQRLGND